MDAETVLQIIIKVLAAIGTALGILTFYKSVRYVGVVYNKTFMRTQTMHRYGLCIAARNEQKVIRNLLESIANQDYDLSKLTVFVVADNCTDGTADAVREFMKTSSLDIVLCEHNDPNERTKGYALRYLFDRIIQGGGVERYDGYFIFDADNVLNRDYVTRMNEAFDEGYDAVTSFRNSKNTGQNWISFSYAMHWLNKCATEHRGNNLFHLSCRIQGTGFLFSNKYVKNGWNYVTFTEDRDFCSDVVLKGGRVVYCEAARFYDEQPSKLKVAWRQRVRWAKGHLQSSVKNGPRLFKAIFNFDRNSLRAYDMFWLNFPAAIESVIRKIVSWGLTVCVGILFGTWYGAVTGILTGIAWGLLEHWVREMAQAAFVYIFYRKQMQKIPFFKLCFYIFMDPLFTKIGNWANYVALFKRVTWKEIPHDYTVDVNKLP